MPYRLLFVCLGNICRSPAAENIMNHLIAAENLQDKIVCDSAGTSDYHIGSPPDRRMTLAATARGIKMTGAARQFEAIDFDSYDLILAMDKENYRNILDLDPDLRHTEKVRLMCDYAANYPDQEVPDPYYGGSDGFKYVMDLLSDACQGLLAEVKTQL